MLKYTFASLLIASTAFATQSKETIVECTHVTILKVEEGANGEKKTVVVHPHVLKCEEPKPKVVPTKAPRVFPRQP
jgi:3D (Asp-Asp-Asp) domain-containing protein